MIERITRPGRALAIAEGLLVSLIWASSFVIIKVGLTNTAPLTLAGMRYFTAFLLLLPLFRGANVTRRGLATGDWLRLGLLGICAYTIGNGSLFWGLQYLSATTGSFLLALTPLLVLFLGIPWLREVPTSWQVVGLVVTLIGSGLFFSPGLAAGELTGLAVVLIGLLAFAVFGVLGREIAREQRVTTLPLTAIPLAIGGGLLLLIAIPLEGLPGLSPEAILLILWLALVNTALAYLMYNHALQVLTALEMNVLLNLSPMWTAIMAALLLAEQLTWLRVAGIILVVMGVALVQWRK